MKMNEVVERAVPTGESVIRAVVATIPFVGGALDHLMFDKASEIRFRNVESSLEAMAAKIMELGESKIDKAWFESAEALQAMSILAERTQYESSSNKRQLVGEMVANCGAVGNSTDSGKLSVLEHVSRLSSVQIGLLRVVSETPATERTGSSGGSIEVTGSAKWIDAVGDLLKRGVKFWEGTLQVMEELEILIASGFLKRVELMGSGDFGVAETALGNHALKFLSPKTS